MMHPIPEILDELRAGRMVVLVDDEKRENEGDLVCAAEFASPDILNFMLKEARGMMCVPMSQRVCDRLDLPPQSVSNTSQRTTAYTISVDAHARFGLTTGVSAADRARTCKVLADPESRPIDLDRPGHMHPLRARDGGVLVRAGQTEGSVDLCKLAGLEPVAVIIEIMNDDGTMARRGDLEAFCQKHRLKMCSVADVIHYRLERDKLVQRVERVPFENELGRWHLNVYRSQVDPMPHVALTCGPVGEPDGCGGSVPNTEPTLVRMHSQNLLGDVFGDTTQPSGDTLRASMAMIQKHGSGAIVYLRHEGMGTGVLKQLQTLALSPEQEQHREESHRPGDAHDSPGVAPRVDKHGYGIGCQILRDLGLHKLNLITDHPFTPQALRGFELSIENFVPVER
ncbi:MAG: 3,4-dihydroxy-2-butanone-4-phosphate synthase [Phycisphaerales bacterium JB063]